MGIGALLDDGLGDTVRVSLTEDPEEEIPVAFAIVKPYNELLGVTTDDSSLNAHRRTTGVVGLPDLRDPYHYMPRPTYEVANGAVKVGGMQPVAVVASPDLGGPDVTRL